MNINQNTNIEILFARVGYELLSLSPKDQLQLISLMEKEAELLRQNKIKKN